MAHTNADLKLLNLFDSLSAQNLQINPFYIKIAGSIVGGYFLTQLIYLARAYKYEEFFKKDDYFREKLLLSEWELRAQKKELEKRGLIKIRLGRSKVAYYTINIQAIIDLAVHNQEKIEDKNFENEESSDSKTRNPQIRKRGILGNHIRKNNTTIKHINKNNIINGHVDNFDDYPSVKNSPSPKTIYDTIALPETLSPTLMAISQIPGVTIGTTKHFLLVPEYVAMDIYNSYLKNRNRVRDVNKYLIGAIKNRGRNENVL